MVSLYYFIKHKIHVLGKWKSNAVNAFFKLGMERVPKHKRNLRTEDIHDNANNPNQHRKLRYIT